MSRVITSHFDRLRIAQLGGAFLVAAAFVAASVTARGPMGAAAQALANEQRLPLLVAALCAPCVPATTSAAWYSVLAACRMRLSVRETWNCYGIGSLANTFLPGRLGDALRIELFARRLPHAHRRWFAAGVSTSVGLAQSTVFGLVLAGGALAGALPPWAIAPAFALPAAALVGGRLAARRRPDGRIACLATAAKLPWAGWARLLAWIAAGSLARLTVVAAILVSLSTPHPLATAVVALCGLAVGNALPFLPGGIGVSAATMTVALGGTGVPTSTAMAAAVTFHAFETGAGIVFAVSGWLLSRVAPREATLLELPAESLALARAA